MSLNMTETLFVAQQMGAHYILPKTLLIPIQVSRCQVIHPHTSTSEQKLAYMQIAWDSSDRRQEKGHFYAERKKETPSGVKPGEMNKRQYFSTIDCFYISLRGFNQKIQEQRDKHQVNIGIDIYTLIYIKQITNKNLLYKKSSKQFLWCPYIYLGLWFPLKLSDRLTWLCDVTSSSCFSYYTSFLKIFCGQHEQVKV